MELVPKNQRKGFRLCYFTHPKRKTESENFLLTKDFFPVAPTYTEATGEKLRREALRRMTLLGTEFNSFSFITCHSSGTRMRYQQHLTTHNISYMCFKQLSHQICWVTKKPQANKKNLTKPKQSKHLSVLYWHGIAKVSITLVLQAKYLKWSHKGQTCTSSFGHSCHKNKK